MSRAMPGEVGGNVSNFEEKLHLDVSPDARCEGGSEESCAYLVRKSRKQCGIFRY